MEARTRCSAPRSQWRAQKSTGATQGPLGDQWKLFERLIPALFWSTLLFSSVSLGFFLYFWWEFSFLAMAVGFVALAIATKSHSMAARSSCEY